MAAADPLAPFLSPPDGASGALARALRLIQSDPGIAPAVASVRILPPRPEESVPLPEDLAPALREALAARGIVRLYAHQGRAVEAALAGEDVLQVTPTASGKSLGYLLPVLHAMLTDPSARALFLFPTKALAQDQLAETRALAEAAGASAVIDTYDGDTPPDHRKRAEIEGRVVLTNPDMLHQALLPHHTRWIKFLEGLRYVVIDELHTYRGVFGSHVANVIRRLDRLALHYGSAPTLLMASATVGNPEELAERLTGRRPFLVNTSGAPEGGRLVALVNPPPPPPGGTRPSALRLAARIAGATLGEGVPTILFAPSRTGVEVAYRRLASRLGEGRLAAYRGGYLPSERRRVEAGLRSGEITGVVSTNALELGVDIGQLEASVLAGFPPTVASAWQQMGRAGRRRKTSVSFVVASPSPRDQYLAAHPDLFFGTPPESALVNPENLHVLLDHLKASAFELPFRPDEPFGGVPDLETLLAFLADGGVLRRAGGRYFYADASFPAHDVSLRSAQRQNVVIVDTTDRGRVIGEVDRPSAPTLVHDQAIYLHMGKSYEVIRLDLDQNKAYVRPAEVRYYTDANLAVGLRVLRTDEERPSGAVVASLGDVRLTWLATIFKKIDIVTGENLGWGRIALPEDEMHTRAVWFALPEAAFEGVPAAGRPDAVAGLGHALHGLLPLLAMTSPRDVGVHSEVRSPFTRLPTVTLFDRIPGGVGIAEQGYRQAERLMAMAAELVAGCGCLDGCPSCVGSEGRRGDVARVLAALAG